MPAFPPIAFYSAVRLGDPEQLAKIMEMDPYYVTQDNGAGAPIHFATTYKQLDMVRAGGRAAGGRQHANGDCEPLHSATAAAATAGNT